MEDERYISKVLKATKDPSLILAAIRTIEAEKRTHLSELRTGIGILTIPLSLLTILVATSNYYSVQDVFIFIVGLIIGIILLAVVGSFLVIKSLQRLRTDHSLRRETCNDTGEFLRDLSSIT